MNSKFRSRASTVVRLTSLLAPSDWREVVENVIWVALLPFRLVAAIWRFGGPPVVERHWVNADEYVANGALARYKT